MIGTIRFYGLDLEVTDDVLRPYFETEMLVERAIEELCRLGGDATMIDMGTGSGNIAIATAINAPLAKITASDISSEALVVAQRNAERHGVADRIEFVLADMANGFTDDAFDVVVSNPPYCSPAEIGRENFPTWIGPRLSYDGGLDGKEKLLLMLSAATRIVKPNGLLITELNDGDDRAIHDAAVATGNWRTAEVFNDHMGIERCLKLRRMF